MHADSTFDAGRLKRLNALLEQALALPDAERDSWLAALPDADRSLAPSLQSLLVRGSVETDTFMQRPLAARLDAIATLRATDDAAGDRIGPWRLLRELGSGGMATVWLAERADGGLARQVALKLPRSGWALGLAQRMARERDLLAALEHPHIARLYDAGVAADGRPWMAMEFIDGQPIDEHCAQHQLGVKAQVQLLLQVCDALTHAHARLIVHRDLKPANILVTAQGDVRLLDFGVGKLLQDDDSPPAGDLTQVHGTAITPDYASPEQVARKPVTVATDIYSLGVVMYELLSGQRPYRLQRQSTAALEEAILAADVPRASTRAADHHRAAALRGDLDAVLAMALAKRPEQRYPNVEALARDLRAHLDGRPVSAQAPSRRYRAWKFLQRNQRAVLAGALLASSLLAGLAGTLSQAQRAERERDRALEELRFAEAADELLRFTFSEGGNQPFTAQELLRRAEQQVQQRFSDAPGLRARLQLMLADLSREGNDMATARQVAQRAHASAQIAGDTRLLAQADCFNAAMMSLAGQAREGQALQAAALRSLAPATPNNEPARLFCHNTGTLVHLQAGNHAAMLADAQAGLALMSPPRPGQQVLALDLQSYVAEGKARQGDLAGAIRLYQQVAEAQVAMGRGHTTAALAVAGNLASYQARAGLPLLAARHFEGLLAGSASPPDVRHAPTLINHARVLLQMGRFAQARPLLQQGLGLAQASGNRSAQAAVLQALAQLACRDDPPTGCAAALAEAEAGLAQLAVMRPSLRATAPWLRAQAAFHERRYGPAREQALAALAVYQSSPEHNAGHVHVLALLARLDQATDQPAAARERAQQAVDRARAMAAGLPHTDALGHALAAQGEVLAAQGDHAAARHALQAALQQLQPSIGDDAPPARRVAEQLRALQP